MSLTDLPDELIAHLTSYLDYPDICNLMETSKKNYNAIKYYRKDKLNLVSFRCFASDFTFGSSLCEYWASDDKHNHLYYSTRSTEDMHIDMKKILEHSSSIETVVFDYIELSNATVKVINESRTKIGSLSIYDGRIEALAEEFITMCKKTKSVIIVSASLNKELWNDHVFVSVMPYMKLETNYCNNPPSELTDRTLEAIVKENKSFDISGTVNSFTIEGIVNALKTISGFRSNSVSLELGVLQSRELLNAHRYFNPDTGELRNQYNIIQYENRVVKEYMIYVPNNSENDDNESKFVFWILNN